MGKSGGGGQLPADGSDVFIVPMVSPLITFVRLIFDHTLSGLCLLADEFTEFIFGVVVKMSHKSFFFHKLFRRNKKHKVIASHYHL